MLFRSSCETLWIVLRLWSSCDTARRVRARRWMILARDAHRPVSLAPARPHPRPPGAPTFLRHATPLRSSPLRPPSPCLASFLLCRHSFDSPCPALLPSPPLPSSPALPPTRLANHESQLAACWPSCCKLSLACFPTSYPASYAAIEAGPAIPSFEDKAMSPSGLHCSKGAFPRCRMHLEIGRAHV